MDTTNLRALFDYASWGDLWAPATLTCFGGAVVLAGYLFWAYWPSICGHISWRD